MEWYSTSNLDMLPEMQKVFKAYRIYFFERPRKFSKRDETSIRTTFEAEKFLYNNNFNGLHRSIILDVLSEGNTQIVAHRYTRTYGHICSEYNIIHLLKQYLGLNHRPNQHVIDLTLEGYAGDKVKNVALHFIK